MAAVLFAFPLCGCSTDDYSPDLKPHLISKPDDNPTRPIDGVETAELSELTLPLSNSQYRARVEELYQTVVDLGKKPVLGDDDPVKHIYDAAVAILDRYVQNAWHTSADGEFRKAHTIHDWLVYYVKYDFELYDRYQRGEDVADNPAFDIDGVFLNKRAVCNGLSRAAAFLFAIEGIKSMRVTGTYLGVPHAWNKVNVGGTWYNIDVTADSANYTYDKGKTYKKQLSHGYFLLSDKTYLRFSPSGRPEMAHIYTPTVEAPVDYDYYTGLVTVGDDQYPLTVTSQAEPNEMFYDIGKAGKKIGKIDLKLACPNKDTASVNNGDIYANEIAEASRQLYSPDFSVEAGNKPDVRYPNGVYLFWLYY